MRRIKEFPLVYVRFWDHCQDSADLVKPIICELFGILKAENDLCYTVVTWISDYNLNDSNSDAYCVLKSAVVEYKVLEIKNGGRDESQNEKRNRRGKKAPECSNQVAS